MLIDLSLIDINVVRLGLGLVVLVITNIILGSLGSLFTQTFDKKILLQGVIKGVIVVVCFGFVYLTGILNPNVIAIELNGEAVNLLTAVNIVITAGFIFYAKEVIIKLVDIIKGHVDIGEGK